MEERSMPELRKIPVSAIITDAGTQIRYKLDDGAVAEYRDRYETGEAGPPLEVVSDGLNYWLTDGFHRLRAAKLLGFLEIECSVHEGNLWAAQLRAVDANHQHGVRLTNEDKRRAVRLLLAVQEREGWSDRDIARMCRVTHTFVSSLKVSHEPTKTIPNATGNRCHLPDEVTIPSKPFPAPEPAPEPAGEALRQAVEDAVNEEPLPVLGPLDRTRGPLSQRVRMVVDALQARTGPPWPEHVQRWIYASLLQALDEQAAYLAEQPVRASVTIDDRGTVGLTPQEQLAANIAGTRRGSTRGAPQLKQPAKAPRRSREGQEIVGGTRHGAEEVGA
jgi:hypothetical protein